MSTLQGNMRWEQGQNMRKYAQIYAQNMRNPENGVGLATPYTFAT
jgi:hypothetical protein